MLQFFRAVSALTVSMDLIHCFWREAAVHGYSEFVTVGAVAVASARDAAKGSPIQRASSNAPVSALNCHFLAPFAYDAGRSRDGEARPASSTAKMPVRNMPSNVPAPPMEAIGAPRLPILSRLRISAPISVPMDPPI